MKTPFAAALGAIAVLVASAAPASAADVRTLQAAVTPAKAQSTAGVSLRLITNTDNGTVPNSGAHDDIYMPRGMVYNGPLAPNCPSVDGLIRRGPAACARGAEVGSGSVTALLRRCGENPAISTLGAGARQTIALKIYNGPRGRSLLALLRNPVIQSVVLPIQIQRAGGIYGLKFVFDVNDRLIQPVHGLCASLVDVRLKIDRRTLTVRERVGGRTVTRRRGLIQTGACTGARRWAFRNDVRFISGLDVPGTDRVDRRPVSTSSGRTTVACSR